MDATPASYRASPTGFSAASIAAGRRVFAANCVPCHGKAGDGTGGLGQAANLRSPHIWSHPDGDLFWFISHGIAAHDGIPAMPAWRDSLSEEARWNVIDYIHALNAGSVTRGLDGWPHLVPAPNASLSCDSLAAHSIGDLRGKAIRLILGSLPQPLPALPPVNGIEVVTVWMPGDAAEAIRPMASIAWPKAVTRRELQIGVGQIGARRGNAGRIRRRPMRSSPGRPTGTSSRRGF